jgi:hypothetical protein
MEERSFLLEETAEAELDKLKNKALGECTLDLMKGDIV